MIHKLDKETIKRIVNLHREQGLSFSVLGERFGVSTSRINQIIKYHGKKQQDASDKTFKVSSTYTSH
jgi:DNA-directed RNA polymerase specialized sigma subunit